MTTSTADRDTSPPSRVDTDDGTAAVSRLEPFRRYTYWSMVVAVIVALLLPAVTGPMSLPPDPLGSVSWLALVALIATLFPLIADRITPAPDHRTRSARWRRSMLAVGGTASLVVAVTSLQSGANIFWTFPPAIVASVAIAPLPRPRRRLAVVAMVVVAIGVDVAVAAGFVPGVDVTEVATASSATAALSALFLTMATAWTWEVAVQLDEARKQAATLAVANERLRFAADLHDIQGHHLQVIALKSELAGRLMDNDPDTAQREIAEVRQLAADALSDTRAVVHGYRRTSLDAEINNASSVLRSAGIDTRLHQTPDLHIDGLDEESRHVLGLVVREAVTNALRHSNATRADISLEHAEGVRLTITNDGVTTQRAQADGGLRDLADRVRHTGGVLNWTREGSTFRVEATLADAATGTVTNTPGTRGGQNGRPVAPVPSHVRPEDGT